MKSANKLNTKELPNSFHTNKNIIFGERNAYCSVVLQSETPTRGKMKIQTC